MAQTPEGRVKNAIKAVLRDMGAFFFMPVPGGYGIHGVPDFICCIGGSFVAIEAKAPGKAGNTTANQRRHLAEIQEAGGVALVIDSADQAVIAEAVQQRIEALARQPRPAAPPWERNRQAAGTVYPKIGVGG